MSYLLARAVRRIMFPSLKIEDVFSVDLWAGNDATQSIISGIDMTGVEDGMVWVKQRTDIESHVLTDTLRGVSSIIRSDTTAAEFITAAGLASFDVDGFTLSNNQIVNGAGDNYVGWSFIKAPRFFDVIKYTGDSNAGRTIPHGLGVVPGMVVVKNLTLATNWTVQHISLGTKHLILNSNIAESAPGVLWPSNPTSTEIAVGSGTELNTTGSEYIMYVLAHDPAANGVIQCGQYTGNGSTSGPSISLGWQPQYIMIKRATGEAGADWQILDTVRGLSDGNDAVLVTNEAATEVNINDVIDLTATGFDVVTSLGQFNSNGDIFIYMAIRAPD